MGRRMYYRQVDKEIGRLLDGWVDRYMDDGRKERREG